VAGDGRAGAAPGWRALRDRDHTRGSLGVSLAVLALPLLATSLSQVAFQLTDLGFVSRLGEDAVTALVVTSQALRQVAFMIVMGASFGAQGLVSRHVGAGEVARAEHVAGQTVVLGLLLSCVFAAVGGLFPAEMLSLMKVSPGVQELGVPYVRLVFLLNFVFVFLFLFNAILNGAGDSTTPLLVMVVQTLSMIAFEWILIFGRLGAPALGLPGAALGMAAGQGVAAVLALSVLFRGRSRVHLRLHHLAPDPRVLGRLAALAWPPALQMLGGFLVNAFFLRMMGELGGPAQAAYSIGLRLSMTGPMIVFPLAGAAATLVGQNLGAGRVDRAWRSLRSGLAASVAILWSLAAAMAFWRTEIVGLLADDPAVVALGSRFLLFQAGTFVAWAFYFVLFRSLQGAGDVRVPMLISLATSLGVTLPLGLVLVYALGWGPTGAFTATLTGSWVMTALTGAWVATGRWTRRAGTPA